MVQIVKKNVYDSKTMGYDDCLSKEKQNVFIIP